MLLVIGTWSLVIIRKHISFTAHGEQYLRLSRVVAEFFPQADNVHVDGAGWQAIGADSPDVRQQLLAGDRPAGVVDEVAEQLDFPLGKLAPRAVLEPQFPAREVRDAGVRYRAAVLLRNTTAQNRDRARARNRDPGAGLECEEADPRG